jgi:hypothetical protein
LFVPSFLLDEVLVNSAIFKIHKYTLNTITSCIPIKSGLRIHAPGYGFAVGAGSVEGASAKIPLKVKSICPVHIPIARQITIAGRHIGTRIVKPAPAKILFKDKGIGTILVRIAIKIALAFTGITAAVALRGQGV